jgi:hypothetical protein
MEGRDFMRPCILGLRLVTVCIVVAGGPLVGRAEADDTPAHFSRHLYPLAKAIPAPEVTIDVTDVPEARPWAEQAQALAREWFPLVTQLLATEKYTPPKTLKLTFKKELRVPAYASRDEITISGKWIASHPDDFGMVIHEMTHIIQSYPRGGNKPGWLVEGVADYIRWWRYEPESRRTPINPDKASYKDSYRTTAAFLAWAVGKYDRTLVRQLDEALRAGTYSDGLFEKAAGKTLEALWEEFVAPLRKVG